MPFTSPSLISILQNNHHDSRQINQVHSRVIRCRYVSILPADHLRALITAPRRSDPTPNTAGTLAIYSVSTYDLDAHKEYKEVRILKVDDSTSTLLSNDSDDADPQWLGDTDQILYQRSTGNEETELWIANGSGEKKYASKHSHLLMLIVDAGHILPVKSQLLLLNLKQSN